MAGRSLSRAEEQVSPRRRGRAAPSRSQRGAREGGRQASGLPWLSSAKTFALQYGQGVVRAGCGLCQQIPAQRSAKIVVSLCVMRRCPLCCCRLAVWDRTPVPAGSPPFLPGAPCRCSLSEDRAPVSRRFPRAGSASQAPLPVNPGSSAPCSHGCSLPLADEVSAAQESGQAGQEDANRCHRALL